MFDFTTFAYDFFWRDKKIIMIGPPSPEHQINEAKKTIFVGDRKLADTKHAIYTDKIIKIIIESPSNDIGIDNNRFSLEKIPTRHRGRNRVLYTLQKDNPTPWINEWMEWYRDYHNIDTVIIYDNNSTAYTSDTLEKELTCQGVEIVIETCPFKYGPGANNGSKWDSDYLQYAMLERVRYKHCNNDSQLINADIDELVCCKDDQSIFSYLPPDASTFIYPGRWIEVSKNFTKRLESRIRHSDHTLIDLDNPCPKKWAANLKNMPDNAFLRVHDVRGPNQRIAADGEAIYLHHRQINTNWKYNRSKFFDEHTGNFLIAKHPGDYFSASKHDAT